MTVRANIQMYFPERKWQGAGNFNVFSRSLAFHCLMLSLLIVVAMQSRTALVEHESPQYVEVILGSEERPDSSEPLSTKGVTTALASHRFSPLLQIPVVMPNSVKVCAHGAPESGASRPKPTVFPPHQMVMVQAGVNPVHVPTTPTKPALPSQTFSELDGQACRIFYQGEAIAKADPGKARGMYREALSLMELAIPLLREELGANRENAVLAMALRNTGRCHDHLGDYKTAEAWFQNSMDMYDRVSGNGSVDRAISMVYLGDALCAEARFDEAEQQFLQSLPIYEKSYGARNQVVAWTHQRLGNLYSRMGRTADSEREHKLADSMLSTAAP